MSTALKKGARSTGNQRSNRAKGHGRFANRLLAEWKKLALPVKETRLVVAVSGGADSVALLLALNELLKTERLALSLTVAHLDHGLRDSSASDAGWVKNLAANLGYEFELERVSVKERAEKLVDNLEQAARRTRYEFFKRVATSRMADAILTAHTMDDQAETVLLRLLRGSGTDGLGGIEPVRLLDAESNLLLARPLLNWARRADTESYCHARGIEFRLDEMNEDESFARVRVRKRLIPLMQSFNGRAVEGLARTAQLLREDASVLESIAARLLYEAREGTADDSMGLRADVLANAPEAVRRRALRRWLAEKRGSLRRLEMVHLLSVERLLWGERGGRLVELPGGGAVSRRKGRLFFHVKKVENGDERD